VIAALFKIALTSTSAANGVTRQPSVSGHRCILSPSLAYEFTRFDSIALAVVGTFAESLSGAPQTDQTANSGEKA